MAPTLPTSLSPQICILSSPDLTELLEKSSLPPLPHILQSFSPLPQVTTRTTTLVSIPHTSFYLRFSELLDLEEACREDEEQRAIRTIDWMTARIGKRCARWVQDIELAGDKENLRTPWWDELRRCSEGDFVPAKTESWNHPVALILAVSTMAPNPLNAITTLHARSVQLPAWVDSNYLRYTLIIHPKNSPLSDEEAAALFNAVKKQFGLHSYFLPLTLPQVPPPPVPVPALLPRLPLPPAADGPSQQSPSVPTSPNGFGNATGINTLRMEDNDIQQTARFTREFLVMSLIPWMEKCVMEWNENFTSTRRLPSRLFSSTRRLFGSQSPSPAPPSNSANNTSATGRSSVSSLNGNLAVPSQQRRLAEFATILGDYKLAITVWEALRKESKGGSDILPLLLAPSPTVPLHAQTSLTSLYQNMTDIPPHAQLCALSYAVRWEAGISPQDLLSDTLEGERWLVWAASNAEEAPSALLLAQAALLSVKRKAWRRAALWYVLAANRLEKCGIKPLTMYFLRKAHDIYQMKSPKELSPSFWESEGKSPSVSEGLEDILSGIEHPLGRLLYTTGDLAGAVKLFLKLLRGASAFSSSGLPTLGDGSMKAPGNDKVYLDDFKVAYSYWKSTNPEQASTADLQIPIKLCVTKQSRLRFPGDSVAGDADIWTTRQGDWMTFSKGQGIKANIAPSGKTSTDELFWMDLVMQNPLDAEINLTNVTLVIMEVDPSTSDSLDDFVEVEVIKDVTLDPKASISVPISLKCKRPTNLIITHAKYDFLGHLPVLESLASRGRRLHGTALQRQRPTYAPDVLMQVKVVPSDHKLDVKHVDDNPLVMLQGQNKSTKLWLTNAGTHPISEVWMISGTDDELWIGSEEVFDESTTSTEILQSSNSLISRAPHRVALGTSGNSSVLQPGEHVEVPFIIHDETVGNHKLCVLFVFREDDSQLFHSTKLVLSYEILPLFELSVSAEPSQAPDRAYVLDIDIINISQTSFIDVVQITTMSPQWSCHKLTEISGTIAPLQSSRILLEASPWLDGSGSMETSAFIARKLDGVLKGTDIDSTPPPPIDLQCNHLSESLPKRSILSKSATYFVHNGRRKHVSRNLAQVHSYISSTSHSSIFPLYNPSAVDVMVLWEVPSQCMSGHMSVYGVMLGAGHAALEDILEDADNAKTKRSMYAETRRENREILDAIRGSDWNMEMNPIAVSVKDLSTKVHNFETGPCRVSVEFQLRNHSLQLPVEYTLKLNPSKPTGSAESMHMLPPPYLGRLTFRGTISPSGFIIVQPQLWITRPGTYSLCGWTLETEISIPSRNEETTERKRRYLQEPSAGNKACIIVCNNKDLSGE